MIALSVLAAGAPSSGPELGPDSITPPGYGANLCPPPPSAQPHEPGAKRTDGCGRPLEIDLLTICGVHGFVGVPIGSALPECPARRAGAGERERRTATGLFLAERYLPANKAVDLAAVVDHDRTAARCAAIRHVRTTYAPGDETSFSLFEAPSLETIQQANDRFQLGYRRVTAVLEVESDAEVQAVEGAAQ